MRRALPLVLVIAWSARALAYPQFQVSRDETCTGCHVSPAGGGLLNENGLLAAENYSQWGTAPEFLNGLVKTPDWLELGGDLRGAAGMDGRWDKNGPNPQFVHFPMQADLDANATLGAIQLHVMAGARDPEWNNTTASTLFMSREHWLQWQQNPGGSTGLYIRAGRFMPVYGLRFIEHPIYTRQYGGTPLYAETYGVAAEYITPAWEVHATGFVHDTLQPTTELGNGAAVYAETRLAGKTAVGVESKLDITDDDRKLAGGLTAKHYLESPGVFLQGELQLVHDKIAAGGSTNGLVGYIMGTVFVGAVMVDVGAGLYQPSLTIRYLDQEAADLNVHWFATSHVEVLLINRVQMLELGAGGLTSGYSLLQVHYRL